VIVNLIQIRQCFRILLFGTKQVIQQLRHCLKRLAASKILLLKFLVHRITLVIYFQNFSVCTWRKIGLLNKIDSHINIASIRRFDADFVPYHKWCIFSACSKYHRSSVGLAVQGILASYSGGSASGINWSDEYHRGVYFGVGVQHATDFHAAIWCREWQHWYVRIVCWTSLSLICLAMLCFR